MTFGLELALAGALLGPAQQPQKPADPFGSPPPTQPRRDNSGVYEDIEIMRQLLARKLAGFGGQDARPHYGPQTSSAGTSNGQPQSTLDATANLFLGAVNPYAHPAISATYADAMNKYVYTSPAAARVEGVYLERAGVVFTVTLPAPEGDPRPSSPKTTPSPAADEWERTRKELRGEKSDSSAPTPSQPPTVGDVILRMLADNGKHFRSLSPDEKVTVVVTFRGGAHQSHSQWSNYPPVKTQTPTQNAGPFSLSGGGSINIAVGDAAMANDLELLADLHLKQQQYDKALEASRKAIAQIENEMKQNPTETKGKRQRLAALYGKQAQALLAAGNIDAARAPLDQAAKLFGETTGANVSLANKAKPEGTSLPAKLIISAPKNLLDAVGSGKIDYEAFRQQVSVEYLTFGEEKPKSKP